MPSTINTHPFKIIRIKEDRLGLGGVDFKQKMRGSRRDSEMWLKPEI